MKTALLVLKLLLLLYLGYLFIFLATAYEPEMSGYRPPVLLFVLDTMNLFIHEAGHFFLRPFGRFIEILGGSVFQCAIPLLVVLVSWRQNVATIPYGMFWLGENLVNVSVYIKDAPYKRLHLIARGVIHDWNWLLGGDPDVAEPLGTGVFIAGLVLCFAAVGIGVYFSVRAYRRVDV
jgi:hypothetical protein